jgi:hypothetical protein
MVATEESICDRHDDEGCDVLNYFLALFDIQQRGREAELAELEYIAPTLAPDASVDDWRAMRQEGIARLHPRLRRSKKRTRRIFGPGEK